MVALPDNIDALLGAGWLRAQRATDLYKTAARDSSTLQQLPAGARLERVDGFSGGRIQVRDAGDGRTREAMTGWVAAVDLDVGKAPAARELPQAYPEDTAMDISQVFAPYRSQLDGSPYAPANCGPTAAGMALEAFGISVPPRQLRAAALDAQHMYGNGVGTLITALAQVVQDNGLSAMDLRDDAGDLRRWSLDDIRAHVRQGHPVIVQVRYRSLPGRGGVYYFGDHYILVTGVVGDGFSVQRPHRHRRPRLGSPDQRRRTARRDERQRSAVRVRSRRRRALGLRTSEGEAIFGQGLAELTQGAGTHAVEAAKVGFGDFGELLEARVAGVFECFGLSWFGQALTGVRSGHRAQQRWRRGPAADPFGR